MFKQKIEIKLPHPLALLKEGWGPDAQQVLLGLQLRKSAKPHVDNVGKLCPCLVAAEFLLHLVST